MGKKNAESQRGNQEGLDPSLALVVLAEETAGRLGDAALAIGSQERRPNLIPWGDRYQAQQLVLRALEDKMKAGPKNGEDRLYREDEVASSLDEDGEGDEELE